ncbi:MAG: saccharopine dehydrogenase NADP-binding domain-containing protein [Chloroflexi bacterium]|nr:saccharopine dehydrogenase NADP-binding domain-containing protein [Chloroflexota bacterium]
MNPTKKTRALLFGIGAIGAGIGRLAVQRDDIELVAAVDSAPDKAGQSLYKALEVERPQDAPDVRIEADAEQALANAKPDVVLHATGSYLPDVLPQFIACVKAGANVVSTCEELCYPWDRHPALAKQLDSEAKANGVTVLGTGVNPGFVLDTLAVTLTGVCQSVESIRLKRIVDVGTRREQLQRKVGVGIPVEEFREKAAAGRFGHVGLRESCLLIAAGLGWQLDSIDETLEPYPGAEGKAAGQLQTAVCTMRGKQVIEAVVQMSAGADDPRDEIEIDGVPPVHLVIKGGIAGDHATAGVILNAVPLVIESQPGLVTMLDLPVLRGQGTRT